MKVQDLKKDLKKEVEFEKTGKIHCSYIFPCEAGEDNCWDHFYLDLTETKKLPICEEFFDYHHTGEDETKELLLDLLDNYLEEDVKILLNDDESLVITREELLRRLGGNKS
ncbi:MAG: hypothetical protein ACTSPP_12125 [Candidatus Heimdallarchaeaceae archaeon]